MHEIEQRLAPVIAHRGASAAAPENTLAAIRLAAAEGATWVEFDVKLSRDGHCILIHDELLNRTTNGRGEVMHHDLEELQQLDAGAWFSPRFAGERIPTLEEALALCSELGLAVNLEIKPCPGREHETAAGVVESLRRHWPAELPWPLISSFAPSSLEEVRLRAAELPRGLLVERVTDRAFGMLEQLDCATLNCDARYVGASVTRRATATGRPVLCYTVNEPSHARRLLAMGVRAVFSDRPAAILAAIASQ